MRIFSYIFLDHFTWLNEVIFCITSKKKASEHDKTSSDRLGSSWFSIGDQMDPIYGFRQSIYIFKAITTCLVTI